MAQYDVFHIEERLNEWHPAVLRIDWDDTRKIHKIIMKDAQNHEYTAMHVPAGHLDARVIYRMMEINPERGYNPFDEIDHNIRQREKGQNDRMEDMARDMANNLYEPIMRDYFY